MLFMFAWLLLVAVYYSQHRGSLSVLFLLGCALVLFVLSVIDYRLNMPEQLRQVPLSLCFRRRWDWRFMFATRPGLAPMRTTDCASYLEEARKICSATDGLQASMQTTGNESSETGLDQLRWDKHTSTVTRSTEKRVEPERTECKAETKPSATLGPSRRNKAILVCCILGLLYLFPVIVLMEIKDTTQKTETNVETLVDLDLKLTTDTMQQLAIRMKK